MVLVDALPCPPEPVKLTTWVGVIRVVAEAITKVLRLSISAKIIVKLKILFICQRSLSLLFCNRWRSWDKSNVC